MLPKVLCGFGTTSVSPQGYGCLENLGYVCKYFKIFLVIVCSKKQSESWHHFSREIGDKDFLVALRMIRSVKVDDALSQSSPGCPFPLTENSLLLILFLFYATVYALRYNLKSQSWAGGGSPIALFLTHKRSINQVLPALCFIWLSARWICSASFKFQATWKYSSQRHEERKVRSPRATYFWVFLPSWPSFLW